MTLAHRFLVWRRAADLPVYRSLLGPSRMMLRRADGDVITVTGPGQVTWLTQFHPWADRDYADREFTLDVFRSGDEGYALNVTCPCGEDLFGDDVGDLLREIYKHCGAAGHPRPRFER